MMDNIEQHAADIQALHLLLTREPALKDFRDAFENQEDIEAFVRRAKFVEYDLEEHVINQGDVGNEFYIVLQGQLRAIDVKHDPPRLLGYITMGGILGERSLLGSPTRTATVEVVTRSARLAAYDREDWSWLMGKNSRFRHFFEDLEQRRLKQAAVEFPGRQWDEVVVEATKRHVLAYLATLPLSLTLLIAPILFFLLAEISGLEFLTIITESLTLLATLPFIIIALILMVYHYFDWRNDDFIVTTKRVVHIERILFYGEQRRDAPLTRIQDVTFVSDILDLIFDSDNLRITTAGAGVMELNHIRRADPFRDAIFRERERAKARVAAADVSALRHNIAHQLDWEDQLEEGIIPIAESEATLANLKKTRHYNRAIDYLLPRVLEINDTPEGTEIVWRKHYYVLLSSILLPTVVTLGVGYLFLASFAVWFPFGAVAALPLQIILGIGLLACLFWYIVKYDNWKKDLYVLTNSRIIDIEASAFRLRRHRREGTFDNIQGVYSEVPNLFYKLLNMGDVIIETAGTQDTFTFHHVYDPAFVNREVFNRWALYQQNERERSRDATMGQTIEALKEYHKLVQRMGR